MKDRLDVILTKRNADLSREKAKALIMSGAVFVDNQRVDKVGTLIDENSDIKIKEKLEFVSRGGYKLKKAVESFKIDLNDKKCLDIGASTGGFTDCMLKNNAKHIIAIDVGYGQFDYSLRCDNRVTCMERTNIRNVTENDLEYMADFAAIDVSFISISKVLPVVKNLMKPDFEIVCLIKPQFEAGKSKVGKNGVVRDKNVHIEVINNIMEMATENGFYINGLDFSPIKGPKGNIEFLLYLSSKSLSKGVDINDFDIKSIVETALEKAK